MIRKIGAVTAMAAAGLALFGGVASATTPSDDRSADHNRLEGQAGLLNLNNLDALHNVNVPVGICGNNINALGIQVPIQHALDGLNLPILSPGSTNESAVPESCAAGAINDGGTNQAN